MIEENVKISEKMRKHLNDLEKERSGLVSLPDDQKLEIQKMLKSEEKLE